MQNQESFFLKNSLYQLQIRNFWPKQGQSRGVFFVRSLLTLLLCVPCWITLFLHLVISIKDHVDTDISGDIAVSTSTGGLFCMIFAFVLKQEKLLHLFEHVVAFNQFGKPDNFDKRLKQVNLYSKVYSCYYTMGLIIYMFLRHIESGECRRQNEEKDLHEVCGLIVSFWAPFYVDYFPVKQIILVIQFYSLFIIICGGGALSLTTYEVANGIVLKIKHLKRMLTEVFDTSDEAAQRKQLIFCIHYHKHIIRLQELFDESYRYCNGTYIFLIGVVIAGLANQFMKEKNVGALIHLGGWIFSFFVCCHAGQSIIDQSTALSDSIYNSKWYEAPLHLRKTLMILMIKTQRPFYLHASPISILSYDIYLKLLKTSTSYFALLNQST